MVRENVDNNSAVIGSFVHGQNQPAFYVDKRRCFSAETRGLSLAKFFRQNPTHLCENPFFIFADISTFAHVSSSKICVVRGLCSFSENKIVFLVLGEEVSIRSASASDETNETV